MTARDLFGTENPIGQPVRFKNTTVIVVGVFTMEKFSLDFLNMERAYIPIRFWKELSGGGNVETLEVSAVSKAALKPAMKQAKDFLIRKAPGV